MEGEALTDSSDDLRLDTELVLVPSSNPVDGSALPHGDVRRILDFVPHVSRGERQDEDDREDAPDDSRLDEREEVVPCRVDCEGRQKEDGGDDDEGDRVEWAMQTERFWRQGRYERVKRLGLQSPGSLAG